jgi:hypothetical protein
LLSALRLTCNEPLSKFAFKVYLRRYTQVAVRGSESNVDTGIRQMFTGTVL